MLKRMKRIFPITMLFVMLLLNVVVCAASKSVIITTSDSKKKSEACTCLTGSFQGGALQCGGTGIKYTVRYRKTVISGWTTFSKGTGVCKPNKTFGPVSYQSQNGSVYVQMVLEQVDKKDPGAGWGRIDYDQ